MLLLDAPKNKKVRIINYRGGKGVGFKLRQLGLGPGREVKILRYAPLGGPVMVDNEGRSVAIGRGIASKVEVEVIR
ncbi:MAG: FeoA family protein [Chloroflexota bacterium]|jgi:Fe2+ transport system protein FeoA|nr:FeoA family protein [Chloroflexota bacterium]